MLFALMFSNINVPSDLFAVRLNIIEPPQPPTGCSLIKPANICSPFQGHIADLGTEPHSTKLFSGIIQPSHQSKFWKKHTVSLHLLTKQDDNIRSFQNYQDI